MFEAFTSLIRHRALLLSTVMQALHGRFSGNVLGIAWLVVYPLLFLSMYAGVFVFILGVRPVWERRDMCCPFFAV